MIRPVILPSGDGHPVVLMPAPGRLSLQPLRNQCERLGYAVYDWAHGFDPAPGCGLADWLANLAEHVRGVARLHRRRVSLVGGHLGGLYARELARLQPALTRRVLTLAAPLRQPTLATLAARPRGDHEVPLTAIHATRDRVVIDQGLVEPDSVRLPVRTPALAHDPRMWQVVADRLSRPDRPVHVQGC